jgi:hypothetical protein
MLRIISLTCATVALLATGFAQEYRDYRNPNYGDYPASVPAGARIRVRVDQTIDARGAADGRVYSGYVMDDVSAPDGRLVVPRGAPAELIVHRVSEHDMVLDLESITVRGRRYMVAAEAYETSRRSGLGTNKRTGEYVGGGALFGTIIGAIAGGGKGAAIGALAGGAAGAGAQVLTRGDRLHIPAESVLEFRLDQPLSMGQGRFMERDNGYDRDGYHYHNDYYRRDR